MEQTPEANSPPEINLYFQNSSNPDIFDQISSKNSDSAMLTSTIYPIGNFQNLTISNNMPSQIPPNHNPETNPIMNANISDASYTSFNNPITKGEDEPVVCRIFASQKELKEEKTSDKIFFDMLGSSKLKIEENVMKETVTNVILPDFGANGRFSDSVDLTSSFDHPTIGDELFMRGSTVQLLSTKGSSAEIDRRRDAWIPSNRTRQALITMATSPPGSYVADRDLLTMPGVVLQEDMVDSVYQVVNHYFGESEASQRKVLTLNDVTQDERGLRELIQAECYRAAVNLTSRLLTMYGQGVGRAGYPSKHTLHSVQLWCTRIALLVKLRSWSVAWAESEAWWDLDRPDLYFQFYSELYGGRPGTIVPFSFRVLLAELPQYVHKVEVAFQRLFSVLATVRKILENLTSGLGEDGSHFQITEEDKNGSTKLWLAREVRVLHSILNTAFQQKDYKLTVDILKSLIKHPCYNGNVYQKQALVSGLGRIFLQLGDLATAREHFQESRSLNPIMLESSSSNLRELIDFGLLAIAENDFEQGYTYFSEAHRNDSLNVMVINNMSVCLLYQGKHTDAIALLENVINCNPQLSLYECLLLNVCTLYELESSCSLENKFKVLKLVSKYKGDSISLNCLKLQ